MKSTEKSLLSPSTSLLTSIRKQRIWVSTIGKSTIVQSPQIQHFTFFRTSSSCTHYLFTNKSMWNCRKPDKHSMWNGSRTQKQTCLPILGNTSINAAVLTHIELNFFVPRDTVSIIKINQSHVINQFCTHWHHGNESKNVNFDVGRHSVQVVSQIF